MGAANDVTTKQWWELNFETVTYVQCQTTASDLPFTIEVRHEWAPIGAERFVALVEMGFFKDIGLFRCVKDFIVQFGLPADPATSERWDKLPRLKDDHPLQPIPFRAGMLSYAGAGNDTRKHSMFITFKDSEWLGGSPWETPFAQVVDGFEEVVLKFYNGYGEIDPFNKAGPNQHKIMAEGNVYLQREYPLLDYIKECRVVGVPRSPLKWLDDDAVQAEKAAAASAVLMKRCLFVAGLLLIAGVLVFGVKKVRKVDRFVR